jgi:transcription antitermination factor NusG
VELIKRFLNEHESVEAQSINVDKNSRVKIESGVFMNLEGKVIKVKNKEVEILIESIGYRLVALLPKSKVSIIK